MTLHTLTRNERRGFAMVAVLLVLMALLVLCAPFLLTVRNADAASAQITDRATARIALDSANRHARRQLGSSHPAVDVTPYYDSEDELDVTSFFEELFLDNSDTQGVMWDLDVFDLAGQIDLNSASPHMLANLVGGIARVQVAIDKDTKEIQVDSTAGFLPEGFLWIGSELIGYTEIDGNKFTGLVRGLAVEVDEEGNPLPCGPQPPGEFSVGTLVYDQRIWAVANWRNSTKDGSLRTFDSIEQVSDAQQFAMAGEFGADAFVTIKRAASVHTDIGAGPRWQEPVRVTSEIKGGDRACRFSIADSRWFNAGTTVQITDGQTTEIGIVKWGRRGSLHLVDPLVNDYAAYTAVVRPLARRPVNINTATPEVLKALIENLKLRGRSARITSLEADALVEIIAVSRPFDGFEDFVRRVILPAAGLELLPPDAPAVPELFAMHRLPEEELAALEGGLPAIIDKEDAVALYKNALNANDNELQFSTMPFAFTSRDVYGMEFRASVNAKSGVERVSAVREQVELIVPQRTLMKLWSRQDDFDTLPRLDRGAPGWLTGPANTHRFDPLYGSEFPTRSRPHLGPHDTAPSVDPLAEEPTYTFASREEEGWVQLRTSRTDEVGERAGRVFHFDEETRDAEGRYLPDGPLQMAAGDGRIDWTGDLELMKPVHFSMWLRPKAFQDGAQFLDVGGAFTDSDSFSIQLDAGDLVMRVLDGAGDHPATSFEEVAEIRYPLAQGGDLPGMPLDTWIHVEADVRGNRGDQMLLLVDGKRFTETPGITRLRASINSNTTTIPVESTEGFPDRCVIRIGEELIEVVVQGPETFFADHQTTGEFAGFGGRLARERFQGVDPGVNQAVAFKDADHSEGATVSLYGYALPLASNIPSASATLPAQLGPFGVGRVTGIVKNGQPQEEVQMEPIVLLLASGFSFTLGWGMDGMGDDVEGLVLTPADPNADPAEMMSAFSRNGGYAALLSVNNRPQVTDQQAGTQTFVTDINGTRLGGIEVFHYTGYNGDQLLIDRRGDQVPELKNLANAPADIAGRGSFVFDWNDALMLNGTPFDERLIAHTMVIPISVPISGSGGLGGFPPAQSGDSQFAQITRLGGETEMTEWVRYDEIAMNQLVRDDPDALLAARSASHAGVVDADPEGSTQPPNPSGGGPNGGPQEPPQGGMMLGSGSGHTHTIVNRPPPKQSGGPYWQYSLGTEEDEELLITHATRTRFQFRGVLGTYSHAQPAGALVLPVWKTTQGGVTTGHPGRLDPVMMMDYDPAQPGWPGVVHFAHRPLEYTVSSFAEGNGLVPQPGPARASLPQQGFQQGVTYVALQEPAQVPITAGTAAPQGSQQQVVDSRLYGRILRFPSGERPREVNTVSIGGSGRRGRSGSVPSAVVDEIVFGETDFGISAGLGDGMAGGQLALAERFPEGSEQMQVLRETLRTPLGDRRYQPNFLNELPPNGGLLRVGDEIVAYESYDTSNDIVIVPSNARGLLGTDPQNHMPGESVTYLEGIRASILTVDIGADDAEIPVAAAAGFPPSGTVLIDDELIHYSRVVGNILEMPRRSSEPGLMDREGGGIFRGRYGTARSGHSARTAVIVFPFRYWDRWAEQADAPELHYFNVHLDQPEAFWRTAFWEVEESGQEEPRLGVLQRTDASVPWDTDPKDTNALDVHWDGMNGGEGIPIGAQSDRIEWRVFIRHEPGSFDPRFGLSHGWKRTPRLTRFGAEYLGPSMVLRRVSR